jgi:hydroxypyruvate isomerase
MPKFAANLSMLFTEVDFLDRFSAAARAGFKGVEYLFPYDFEKEALVERLGSNGLTQVLHNLPAGDWAAGERGIACLPDRIGEFQDGVGKAVDYATALGCTQINCLAGKAPEAVDDDRVRGILVDNLKFAAEKLGEAGIKLLVEAINTYDIPGFYVNRTDQALGILDAVGSDNAYYQYDIYHMQRMEGELTNTIQQNLSRIAHLQLADNPGRHEPGTGEINYDHLFRFVDEIGYAGWIGCEYVPAGTTEEGLGWIASYT